MGTHCPRPTNFENTVSETKTLLYILVLVCMVHRNTWRLSIPASGWLTGLHTRVRMTETHHRHGHAPVPHLHIGAPNSWSVSWFRVDSSDGQANYKLGAWLLNNSQSSLVLYCWWTISQALEHETDSPRSGMLLPQAKHDPSRGQSCVWQKTGGRHCVCVWYGIWESGVFCIRTSTYTRT